MKSELQKAVALYEKGQLYDAKKIALNIYNNKPNYFDNLRLLNFICYKKNRSIIYKGIQKISIKLAFEKY